MKKALSFIGYVAIVLVAFSLLTMLFMPKYIEKNTDGRITAEYYREKTPIDVIFVGSSTVQAGISPMVLYREYGITAYDHSNSSQVIPISYAMIQDSIKRNKPELVVLEVGFLYQEDDYVDEGSSRKSLDTLKWSKTKSDCIKAVMDPTENYMDYVFPILRFHSRWNDLKMEDIRYLVYKPTVTHNGQLLQFKDDGKNALYNPKMLEESVEATERTMAYLSKIADTCKENNVQLMLMKLPGLEVNWNDRINQQIIDFAEANELNYIDYNSSYETLNLDQNTDFTDGQHMNSYGAEKFTNTLGEYIINNYAITNRASDPKIKAVFDKKLERYTKDMEGKIPSEPVSD